MVDDGHAGRCSRSRPASSRLRGRDYRCWCSQRSSPSRRSLRGAFEIFAAITLRKELEDEWILGLSGAMSVIFGGLIMFRPGAGLIAITLLIGAYMLALGVFAIALALRLRMMGRNWAN